MGQSEPHPQTNPPARYRMVSSLRDSSTVFRDATCRSIFLLISMLSFSKSAF